MDYKQAIIQEIDALPSSLLPKIHRLFYDFRVQRLSVEQILSRADEIFNERKSWTREQHVNRLLKVAEELREEADKKGVSLGRDEEAAFGS